jgi:redox-sensitive bicupin YhaK (pirin superfamily)
VTYRFRVWRVLFFFLVLASTAAGTEAAGDPFGNVAAANERQLYLASWGLFQAVASGGDILREKLGIRSVAKVVEPQYVIEGAGVKLRRSIAARSLDHIDPFLLFDHFGSEDPEEYLAGFPMHPHRGIDTVTYMLAGRVEHKDSLGNAGAIGAGDVQWMTSGGGILHEEMPKPMDGRMEGFQLWVNLPARLKMSRPRYQEIRADRIPEVRRQDGVRVRVVAGEADGVRGPVTEIAADPEYLDVTVPKGVEFVQPVPWGHTAIAYVFEGEGAFGEEGKNIVAATRLIVFGDGDSVRSKATGDHVRFLLLSGKPLGEPIARHGPFVMNTRQEIEQALEDLRNGTFVWRG